jgi:two-component system, sensor histidine kinase and response regulator
MNTILLIDDETGLRSIFSTALREHSCRVIEAASGSAGLELARQQSPDLILTDISMPGMDGEAVLNHIRQDPELSGKQVVLMTGDPSRVTPRKGMEAGADDFLVKPVSLDALLHCVEARFKRAKVHWRVEDRVLAQLRSSLRSTLPHEFFTPLAGIIGLTEILHSDFKKLSSHEIQDIHNDIHLSALRLHRTLKNYLMILELEDVSQNRSGPAKPFSPKLKKESLLSDIKEATRRNEREEDVTLQVEECAILASPADWGLIVDELVDNACKFSRLGTLINVNFSNAGVLTVTDAGRGMTPEEIERVGVFQQFDRKRNEQQGLGLGLVLVQKLATNCGAKLSVESIPSRGTQVRVAFQTNVSVTKGT